MSVEADLGRDLEAIVADYVTSGRFASADEVLREGVRLLHERETRLEQLDLAIARGLNDLGEGLVKHADEVFDRLEAKYRAASIAKGS